MARFLSHAAILLVGLTVAVTPLGAQVTFRSATQKEASPDSSANQEVVVQGQRRSVMRQLRDVIARNRGDQLARFEDKVCPMVIGMPRDWTAAMTRMIRANIELFGARLEAPGCRPNSLVIFIDQPAALVDAIRKEEPWLLGMEPRTARNFVADVGPITSWHVTDTMGADGETLQAASIGGNNDVKISRSITSSRLYTPVRQEMMLGMVVVEKGRTVGHTLRQLADITTMHLLLEVKASAGSKDPTSILSLFEPRPADQAKPQRLSRLDRGAMAGFYAQRDNNFTAAQQRSAIAKAIVEGAGEQR